MVGLVNEHDSLSVSDRVCVYSIRCGKLHDATSPSEHTNHQLAHLHAVEITANTSLVLKTQLRIHKHTHTQSPGRTKTPDSDDTNQTENLTGGHSPSSLPETHISSQIKWEIINNKA